MKREDRHPYLAAGLTAFAVIAASLCLFFLLFHLEAVTRFLDGLGAILRPIFMGAVIAFLLLPVHRYILRFLLAITPEKQKADPRNIGFLNFASVLLSLLLAFFLIYLLLAMVLPQVYDSLIGVVKSIPDYIENIQDWLQTFFEDNPDIQAAILPVYNSAAASLEQWLNNDILPNLESVASTFQWVRTTILPTVLPNLTGVVAGVSGMVVGFLVLMKDLLIAIIISVYLLVRKDIFAAQSKKIVYSLFRTDIADLIIGEVRNAYRIMSGFINGKLLDSLIIGIICLVCCNIFKFPYPALIAVVVGVTNIIPFFGPFIGAVPCGVLIFLSSPLQAIYFAIFILVLQQFDGNILGPKILGETTGLASFWVLFSILLFGGLFGFAGMVLGVPVFAMIYSVISRLVAYGLRSRDLPVDTSEYMGKTGPMEK